MRETKIISDKFNNIYTLGDRDCSIQRNHQKIIEEAPSGNLNESLRESIYSDSVKIAKECNYVGAGTVEFLFDGGNYYFIEMNTRIQVEHPITEMIFSTDLIKNQILAHSGQNLSGNFNNLSNNDLY